MFFSLAKNKQNKKRTGDSQKEERRERHSRQRGSLSKGLMHTVSYKQDKQRRGLEAGRGTTGAGLRSHNRESEFKLEGTREP